MAVFGSSQIANVKGADGQPELSMPAQLSLDLDRRGVLHEVVDFSTAGQQVSESMIVLFLAGDVAKALEWQTKAVEQAAGAPYEQELRERLEEYREALGRKG